MNDVPPATSRRSPFETPTAYRASAAFAVTFAPVHDVAACIELDVATAQEGSAKLGSPALHPSLESRVRHAEPLGDLSLTARLEIDEANGLAVGRGQGIDHRAEPQAQDLLGGRVVLVDGLVGELGGQLVLRPPPQVVDGYAARDPEHPGATRSSSRCSARRWCSCTKHLLHEVVHTPGRSSTLPASTHRPK